MGVLGDEVVLRCSLGKNVTVFIFLLEKFVSFWTNPKLNLIISEEKKKIISSTLIILRQ